MKFATAYSKQESKGLVCDEPSMTKQQFQKECDINNIIAKFQKTGVLEHQSKFAPRYSEYTPENLADALFIITEANSMFEELPAVIRERFNNSPAEFLQFVQDPDNEAEMIELGLAESRPGVEPTAQAGAEGAAAPHEQSDAEEPAEGDSEPES